MRPFSIARLAIAASWPVIVVAGVVPWRGNDAPQSIVVRRPGGAIVPATSDRALKSLERVFAQLDDEGVFPQASDSEVPAPSVVPPPAVAELPVIVVRGIVFGAARMAILDGIPGAQGATALREGESSSGVTVRAIYDDRVRVSLRDSVWIVRLPGIEGRAP